MVLRPVRPVLGSLEVLGQALIPRNDYTRHRLTLTGPGTSEAPRTAKHCFQDQAWNAIHRPSKPRTGLSLTTLSFSSPFSSPVPCLLRPLPFPGHYLSLATTFLQPLPFSTHYLSLAPTFL
jgi:hypothetical protein